MAKELAKAENDLGGYGKAEVSVDSMLIVKAKIEAEFDIIAEVEKLALKTETQADDKAIAAIKKIRDIVNAVAV